MTTWRNRDYSRTAYDAVQFCRHERFGGMWCFLVHGEVLSYREDGGGIFLWNVSMYVRKNTASHFRGQ